MNRLGLLLICFIMLLSACGRRLPAGQSTAQFEAVILSPTQNALLVFDLLTHRVSAQIPSGGVPRDLVLGAGGLVFVSHAQEPSVMVFQRNDPGVWYRIGKIGMAVPPGRLAWGNHFNELLVMADELPLLAIYSMSGLRRPFLEQMVRLSAEMAQPQALVLSPGGETAYVVGQVLQSLNRSNGRFEPGKTLELPANSQISEMILHGQHLFLTERNRDQILVADVSRWEWLQAVDLGADLADPVLPGQMAVNQAGTKLYVVGAGASVLQVLDLQQQSLLQTLVLNHPDLDYPAAAPAGVAVTANDRNIYVTAQSGRNLVILEGSPDVSEPERIVNTLGTAASEALLPPLGAIRIF